MRYVYDWREKKRFEQIELPINRLLSDYMDWKGYQDDEELKCAEKMYSKNAYVVGFHYIDLKIFLNLKCILFMHV